MKKRTWKIAGVNFDHFHMGDLLRYAHEHPAAEIVGISDEQPARTEEVVRKGLVPRDRAFTDYRACLEQTKPDVVILCPAASKHGEWVKKVAPYGPHIMVEKPFAASLKEADAMIAAMPHGKTLMINWFTSGIATEGGGTMSNTSVKTILAELIAVVVSSKTRLKLPGLPILVLDRKSVV